LLVEALGDAAELFDRVEMLTRQLDATRQALNDANLQLQSRLVALEAVSATATKRLTVAHTDQTVRQTMLALQLLTKSQTGVVRETVRQTLAEQLDPRLAEHAELLQKLLSRIEPPWDRWLTQVASAACSAALTWWLVTAYFQH
jgi:aminopeptidase N